LKLELFNGYNYTEGTGGDKELTSQKGKGTTESLRRSKFGKTQFIFDLSSFQMQTTDKKWFQGNRIMRNVAELDNDIDSLKDEVTNLVVNYYINRPNYFSYFRKNEVFILPPELAKFKSRRDSFSQSVLFPPGALPVETTAAIVKSTDTTKRNSVVKDISDDKKNVPAEKPKKLSERQKNIKSKWMTKKKNIKKLDKKKPVDIAAVPKPKITDSLIAHRIDSIIAMKPSADHYQKAANEVRQVKSILTNNNSTTDTYNKDKRVYEIQWHRIIANSLACIAMFLIGAPLGAIIKKGGLGIPFLVSIFFFIIFYILNMIGEKWAKQGVISVVTGVWSADFILLIIGLIFLRQARIDARLFDTDFYLVVIDKFRRWMKRKGRVTVKAHAG
jgi:lipopolysaccharide export system permease protein